MGSSQALTANVSSNLGDTLLDTIQEDWWIISYWAAKGPELQGKVCLDRNLDPFFLIFFLNSASLCCPIICKMTQPAFSNFNLTQTRKKPLCMFYKVPFFTFKKKKLQFGRKVHWLESNFYLKWISFN